MPLYKNATKPTYDKFGRKISDGGTLEFTILDRTYVVGLGETVNVDPKHEAWIESRGIMLERVASRIEGEVTC